MTDSEPQEQILHKKRRLQNSCDECRKRKIKCDSANRPGNVCTSCLAFKTECTHFSASVKKKRGPPKGTPRGKRTTSSIVKSIISSKETYEPPSDSTLVKQLIIDIAEYAQSLDEENSQLRQQFSALQQHQQKTRSSSNVSTTTTVLAGSSSGLIEPVPPPGSYLDSDLHAVEGLNEQMEKLSINNVDRHYGGSSSFMLLKTVINIKNEFMGDNPMQDSNNFEPIQSRSTSVNEDFKRPEFWTIHPWQLPPKDNPRPFIFPDTDLMDSLVSLYFSDVNIYFPMLHKPSFVRSISQNLHLQDRQFGALVLAVCALGARFSDDPRVYEDSIPDEEKGRRNTRAEQSVGWKWIRQIQLVRGNFTELPSIYEVQLYGIYVIFIQPTTTPEACWVLVSIAVRFAQDVGAHRKKQGEVKPTVESELWKRVFWLLYTMDVFTSAYLGRPRSIAIEDFDIDLPVDCDDEFWENPDDPEKGFQQPNGKLSETRAYVVCLVKLMDVLGFAMRTIYAIRKSDTWTAMGMTELEWNEKIVSELDSALNKWVDEVPDHLRWNPNRQNPVHFNQSVMLYSTYYWVQILIHRPFISQPGGGSVLSFPSLAICVNAARSCCHVIDVQRRRNVGVLAMPNVTVASLFAASIVLLVNVWRGRRLGEVIGATDIEKELADIYRCINLLSMHEQRWQQAGRYCDILKQSIVVSHLHHDQTSESLATKNPREILEDTGHDSGQLKFMTYRARQFGADHTEFAAIDERLSMESSSSTPTGAIDSTFTLPTHSSELGRLPVYESFTDLPMTDGWLNAQSQLGLNMGSADDLAVWPQSLASPSQRHLFDGFETALGMGSNYSLFHPPNSTATSSTISISPSGLDTFGMHLGNGNNELDRSGSSTSGVTPSELEEWGSYLASVDEILKNTSHRV